MSDLKIRTTSAIFAILIYLFLLYLLQSGDANLQLVSYLAFSSLLLLAYFEAAKLATKALNSSLEFIHAFFINILILSGLAYQFLIPAYSLPNIPSIVIAVIISFYFIFIRTFAVGRHDKIKITEHFRFYFPYTAYIGVGSTAILALIFHPTGAVALLWITITVSLTDTGAYLLGKHLGKTPLIPTISPKKTVEGALAGILFGTFGAYYSFSLLKIDLPWYCVLCFCILCTIIGQVGDLIESYLKRLAGIKDSGKFLPGHGGILDRIDSTLAVSPLVLLLLLAYTF